MAGVHGSEQSGVDALAKLRDTIPTRGEITWIVANPYALANKQRFSESDLNRSFSSPNTNTLEEKIAKQIEQKLRTVDALLDLHTSSIKVSEPFAICEKKSLKVAKELPANKIIIRLDKFHSGSSDEYMNKQNKIGICYEAGWEYAPNAVSLHSQAIRSFLYSLNMLDDMYLIKSRTRDVLECVDSYRNKQPFRLAKQFADFEKVTKNTVIGYENNKEITPKKSGNILFAQSRDTAEDCFLLLKRVKTTKTLKTNTRYTTP